MSARKPSSGLIANLALALCIGAGGAAALAQPRYEARFLGGAGGVAAMNESAVVVGVTTSSGQRAWVADPGFRLLPLPPGMRSSVANDVNELGQIVGAIGPSDYSVEFGGKAALWTPDGQGGYDVEILSGLSGESISLATALNNVGDIVGYSMVGMYRSPVLFRSGGSAVDLTPTGIFDPSDVNDRRFVVDHSFTVKRLNLNTMTVENLGVPPGSYLATTAEAINESNQVAGVAILTSGGNCDRVAARYTDGVGWEILSPCGQWNGANDLNDLGDVVMRQNIAPYVRFEGLGTFQIETLINDPPIGHWYVVNSSGLAINNSRRMAVFAHNPQTGEAGAVLLTPVGLYSLAVTNLVGGESAVFTIEGATPLANQYLVYSLRGTGSTYIRQLNVTLDLAQPVLFASGQADASGAFETTVRIPRAATGRTVWFQGAEMNHTTNVLVEVVR